LVDLFVLLAEPDGDQKFTMQVVGRMLAGDGSSRFLMILISFIDDLFFLYIKFIQQNITY